MDLDEKFFNGELDITSKSAKEHMHQVIIQNLNAGIVQTGNGSIDASKSTIAANVTNPIADEVFRLNRANALEKVGAECELESSQILRFSIKNKDQKRVYIYPTDQAPYTKAAKFPIGEFLNQPTNAMLGSVGVACKLSHSVVYLKMKRVERGKYEMTFLPITYDASKETPEALMRKYYDFLEEEIKETPANWLWTHKRWK